jgi:DNA-binding transcriptional MerR regulator
MTAAIPPIYSAGAGAIGRTMPAESSDPSVRKKGTWRDWIPAGSPEPDRLLTRDELIAALGRVSPVGKANTSTALTEALTSRLAITENALRYLEQQGAFPAPTRQWHDGATRAVYPSWALPLLQTVRVLQLQGRDLAEIRAWTRAAAPTLAQDHTPPPLPTAAPTDPLTAILRRELHRLAHRHARLTGDAITGVEIRLVGGDGRATTYHVDIESVDDSDAI